MIRMALHPPANASPARWREEMLAGFPTWPKLVGFGGATVPGDAFGQNGTGGGFTALG
jgi:hypothetical protein